RRPKSGRRSGGGCMIKLKRVRDPVERSDGYRVLVERLWPRGVRKEALVMDEWAKEIAPSTSLRQWFGHDPDRWAEFRRRDAAELKSGAPAVLLAELVARGARGTVTLLYSSHDSEHNNAVVLKETLERRTAKRAAAPTKKRA